MNTHPYPPNTSIFKSNNRPFQKGFSFIELFIVVGIMSLFFAILIPNIGNVSETAQRAAAQINAQSVVSVLNAAQAAGTNLQEAGVKDPSTAVRIAIKGVVVPPSNEGGRGKTYNIGHIDDGGSIDPIEDAAVLISVLPGDDGKLLISLLARTEE